MTPTEKIVADLCKDTFLSFWSFANPIGKRIDKELCDILVVCDPDVIIFSVKEINIKESGDPMVDIERWERNAVEESVKQIYGAERFLRDREEVVLNDRATKIRLPDKGIRNVYRVAVAFGRGDKFPLKEGDFGKGFVHVMDERSVEIILKELDTISDLIDFLNEKETFQKSDVQHIAFSGEDYLAMYLGNGFDIPEGVNLLMIDSDSWIDFSASPEYVADKKENKISYIWDGIIERLSEDFHTNDLINDVSRDELELALRWMNKETRFGRRMMSRMVMDVLGDGVAKPKSKAKIVQAELPSAPLYVIMQRKLEDREISRKELQMRCLVARSMFPDKHHVIGIASEPYDKGKGHSLDLVYMDLSIWTEELQKNAEGIKEDLGYFKSPIMSRMKPDGTIIKS